MKKINYNEYNSNMGLLINVGDEDLDGVTYKIKYDSILYSTNKYLDKNKKYFIICKKGNKSKKVVSILELYGYDVTQVVK